MVAIIFLQLGAVTRVTATRVIYLDAILYLERAPFVTGETLHVDSGYHIMGAPPGDAKLGDA